MNYYKEIEEELLHPSYKIHGMAIPIIANNIIKRLGLIKEKKDKTMEQIKIKYFDKNLPKLEKISKGDWIDLRAAENIWIKKGQFALIPLNVAMEMPEQYEAHIAPRGSTYKHFKVLQTNSVGVVDNSYKGDNDQWFYPVIAMEDTCVKWGERICQFRIVERMPEIEFIEVDSLENENRGGHGSTGKS